MGKFFLPSQKMCVGGPGRKNLRQEEKTPLFDLDSALWSLPGFYP